MIKTLATLAALSLCAGAVQAQMAGTYVGTTSEGLSINITVIDDGTGQLVFNGNTTQWNEACKTGDVKFAWWGVGAYTPLTGRKLTQSYKGNALWETIKMTFSADGQSVSGSFNGGEATYVDVNTSTRKTEECHSAALTYTATLQGAAGVRTPLPAGATQSYAR